MSEPHHEPVPLLDHGFIRLVRADGTDMDIVRSARTSFNASPRGDDKDRRLLDRLMRDRHTSPFEAVDATFEVKCPLFVARQWHRHRTQAYSEVSARYAELPDEFYVPAPEVIGKQHAKEKQARDMEAPLDDATLASIHTGMLLHGKQAFKLYHDLLATGVPRELARSVLPTSTYTRFFAKASIHNWLHFLNLRLDPHAQYEIRVYAEAIVELLKPPFPWTFESFEKHIRK